MGGGRVCRISVDWLFRIWPDSSSRAGSMRGYMVVTASLKGSRSMAAMRFLSTVTVTLTSSLPRVKAALYTPGT